MIRLRWRTRSGACRAPSATTRANLALEVDGVNVLSGGSDEPVLRTTLALLESVLALGGTHRAAELELETSNRCVCLWRTGATAELRILARSPRLTLSSHLEVQLSELARAAAALARELCGREEAHGPGGCPLRALLAARVSSLEALDFPSTPPAPTSEWVLVRPPSTGLGLVALDDCGRSLSWTRADPAALTPLLVPGLLLLPGGTTVSGPPFFALYAALDPHRTPRGALAASEVAKREAGLDLCLALVERSPALRSNPWVEALLARSSAAVEPRRQTVTVYPASDGLRGRAPSDPPLLSVGRVRRVGLQRRWSADLPRPLPGPCRLVVAGRGLTLVGPHGARAASRRGRMGQALQADGGLALAPSGALLALHRQRLLAFGAELRSARWVRGATIERLGPHLATFGEHLVAHAGPSALCAWASLTGAELWRYEPRLARSLFVRALPHRLFVATDEALLLELDPRDGAVRRRLELSGRCQLAPVVTRSTVCFAAALGAATVVAGWSLRKATQPWTARPPLDRPRSLAATARRFFVAGERDGEATVACISEAGAVLWARPVPGAAADATLLALEDDVVFADATGRLTRLSAEGQPVWSVEMPCEPLEAPLAATRVRRVLLVPGAPLRLVEVDEGREIGALDAGSDLSAFAVSRDFELYTYRSSGVLEAWRPSAVLGLVAAPA